VKEELDRRRSISDIGCIEGGNGMARTQAAIMRPFVAVVVLGILLGASACGTLQQTKSDPLKFSSAQHFLQTDRVKMERDLERELEDARAGPNGPSGLPSCYNLKNNVNVDIARMDNFGSRTVTHDVIAMQNDVTTMRAERADFKRDINDFVNDGVARPADEPMTLAEITREIKHAVKHADRMIMAIRADLKAAHSSAKSLATGPCARHAPEGAPTIPLVR
jgi:hypothetical protein